MCAWVSYLGLEDHPSFEMGKKYMRNVLAGSIVCFGVRGGTKNSLLFMDSLKLILQTAKYVSRFNLGEHANLDLASGTPSRSLSISGRQRQMDSPSRNESDVGSRRTC